jgi:hypothetical protein
MPRLLLLTCCALLAGCERVVALDVAEGPRRLVVEARLERILGAVSGTQSITLRTTAPYFDAEAAPPATGATVTVTDDSGRVVPFLESAVPGRYVTDALVITAGRRYSLAITYAGERFESSEVAQTVAPIDSLYLDAPQPGRFSGEGGVRATIEFRDPGGVENYYLWDQFVNGVRQLGPDTSFKFRVAAADDAFDGIRVTQFQPYEGIDIPPGGDVLVRQAGLSEAMFRYYFALSDQVSADGSAFSVPPASVRGNVANRTDPTRYPLGYFFATEVSEARIRREP